MCCIVHCFVFVVGLSLAFKFDICQMRVLPAIKMNVKLGITLMLENELHCLKGFHVCDMSNAAFVYVTFDLQTLKLVLVNSIFGRLKCFTVSSIACC